MDISENVLEQQQLRPVDNNRNKTGLDDRRLIETRQVVNTLGMIRTLQARWHVQYFREAGEATLQGTNHMFYLHVCFVQSFKETLGLPTVIEFELVSLFLAPY